jgi:hypothetical protein
MLANRLAFEVELIRSAAASYTLKIFQQAERIVRATYQPAQSGDLYPVLVWNDLVKLRTATSVLKIFLQRRL